MSLSFFIEMAWKSALISGAALLLVALLRSRSAADRTAVLRVGVALLLLLPVVALGLPKLQVEAPALVAADAARVRATPAIDYASMPAPSVLTEAASVEPASSGTGNWDDPGVLILILYLGGLLMVGGRLIAGLWTLNRWTSAASEVECPQWEDAFERARSANDGLPGLRLLISDEVTAPLSWGWRHPAILIDRDALDLPEDADAILAHEMAHVVRRDWLVLLLARLAVALFWFNPLVWRLEREVAQQAEEAADSQVLARVEASRYAQTLLHWARLSGASPIPANGITSGQSGLTRRIKAILEGKLSAPSGSVWTLAAIIACVGFAAPLAALQLVPAAPDAPQAPATPPAPHPLDSAAPPAVPAAPGEVAPIPLPPSAPHAAMAHHPGAHPVPPVPPMPGVAAHPYVDGEEIQRTVREALGAADVAGITAEVAQRAGEEAARGVAVAMANGANHMEQGARGMEVGARQMAEQARQLRNRDYRERQIARAAARGETVTHEELLEAADGLEEGWRGMLEGAAEMREAAAEMRDDDR